VTGSKPCREASLKRRRKLLNEVSALNGLLYEAKKKLCSSIFLEVVHEEDKEKNN
jgi:hypothetical protein